MATVSIGYSAYCTTNNCTNEEWYEVSNELLSSYKTDKEGADEKGREFNWPYYNFNDAAKGKDDRFLKFKQLCSVCKLQLDFDDTLLPLQVKEVVPDTTHSPSKDEWINSVDLYDVGAVPLNNQEFEEQVQGGLRPHAQYLNGGLFEYYDQKLLMEGFYDKAFLEGEDPSDPKANAVYALMDRAKKANDEARAGNLLGQGDHLAFLKEKADADEAAEAANE